MAAKTVLSVLKGALKILRNEKRWTKGFFAATKQGEMVATVDFITGSRKPYCYCAEGAIRQAACSTESAEFRGALKAIENALPKPWQMIWDWNDAPTRRHDQIVKVFEKAIAAQESLAA